jgi:uncharacterized membrane protein YvbJ
MKFVLIVTFLLSSNLALANESSELEKAQLEIKKRADYNTEKYSKSFGGPLKIDVDWVGYKNFCAGQWKVKSECNAAGIVDYQIGASIERLRKAQQRCNGPLTDQARTITVKFSGDQDSEVLVTTTTVHRHPASIKHYHSIKTNEKAIQAALPGLCQK